MQQLDAVTLKALAQEMQSLLDNAKVSKVQHPSAHEFLITFWGGPVRSDQLNLFFIQLNPEAPFCALTQMRHRQESALHAFNKPTSLCMLLRKHLNGASLQSIRTLPGERVLDLVFENFNELGNKVRLVLSLELMGKHSNMILYDDVQGIILAVAHGVSERMSSYRELAAGLPYAPPPMPEGKQSISAMTADAFMHLWHQKPSDELMPQFLNSKLAGFGQRVLTDTLSIPSPEPKAVYQRLIQLESGVALAPARHRTESRFTLLMPLEQQKAWQAYDSVNAMVGDYFLTYWRNTRLSRRCQQLTVQLEQQAKKLKRREQELVPIADSEIEQLQATGDRLLAAFSAQEVPGHPPAHQGVVVLTQYETDAPWKIEIDPTVGWVENAQIYYRRAKEAKARRTMYQQMGEALHAEQEYLADLMRMVQQAESLSELAAVEADMAAASFSKRTAPEPERKSKKKQADKQQAETTGVVILRSSDGLELVVGKSGQGNEAIVGKLSRSDDVWLHVHQMPGSHVLIRSGQEAIPDQTLLEAAMLAVHYSSARSSVNVPVVYTLSKYVRKIPQSYPGHVNYRQEKTVFITPDEALLDRILSRPQTGERLN